MTNEKPKFLAVLKRKEDIENLYHSFLFHYDHIDSLGIGVNSAKYKLQEKINNTELVGQSITEEHVMAALSTQGQDVMVYFIYRGDQMPMPALGPEDTLPQEQPSKPVFGPLYGHKVPDFGAMDSSDG